MCAAASCKGEQAHEMQTHEMLKIAHAVAGPLFFRDTSLHGVELALWCAESECGVVSRARVRESGSRGPMLCSTTPL